jgi:hypothetical protein
MNDIGAHPCSTFRFLGKQLVLRQPELLAKNRRRVGGLAPFGLHLNLTDPDEISIEFFVPAQG